MCVWGGVNWVACQTDSPPQDLNSGALVLVQVLRFLGESLGELQLIFYTGGQYQFPGMCTCRKSAFAKCTCFMDACKTFCVHECKMQFNE